MIPEQRKRAAVAMRHRMAELKLSAPKLAARSGVSAATIRGLLSAQRWPSLGTRNQLEAALGWPNGELARRAVGTRALDNIQSMTTEEITALIEACSHELRMRLGRDGHP